VIGYNKRETCAGCGGRQFESILNLGVVPLAGYFPIKMNCQIKVNIL